MPSNSTEYNREYMRGWRERNREHYREYQRKYMREHGYPQHRTKEQRRAWTAVERAVKKGTLIRPDHCSECPNTYAIEAHHDDYTKLLEIRWLCCICHRNYHTKEKELGS